MIACHFMLCPSSGRGPGCPRDVLEGGGRGASERGGHGEGGFGWDPPSSRGPPMVPAEGGPKFF